MTDAIDPLAFDFGINFRPSSDRIAGERTERQRHAVQLLPFHVGFLDDYFRGILPHDLILIGADTGAGKTDLVSAIARRNAQDGRNVHIIALEAEPLEIERRTKFAYIAWQAAERKNTNLDRINYVDWYLGRCEQYLGGLDAEADEFMRVWMFTQPCDSPSQM